MQNCLPGLSLNTKQLLLLALPLALALTSTSVPADLLIYEGTTSQVTAGGGRIARGKFPIYTLIDTELKTGFSIPYYNWRGQKTYERGGPQSFVHATLSIGKGKTSTVIMWPIARQAEDPANVAESLVVTGRNTVIDTGRGKLNFPPVLDYTSTSIASDEDTGAPLHFTFKSRSSQPLSHPKCQQGR